MRGGELGGEEEGQEELGFASTARGEVGVSGWI